MTTSHFFSFCVAFEAVSMKIDFYPLTQSSRRVFEISFSYFQLLWKFAYFPIEKLFANILEEEYSFESYSDDSIKCLLNENFQVFLE